MSTINNALNSPSLSNIAAASNSILVTDGSSAGSLSQIIPAEVYKPTIIVTGTSQSIVMGNTYRANASSLITFTLPLTAAIDSEFGIVGQGSGLYKIAQNSSQQILFLSQATTSGVGGSLTATQRYQSIRIRCLALNLFSVITASGNPWTVV